MINQNFVSAFFDYLNSKFDGYACSSFIFKSAGLYIIVTTIFMFVSSDILSQSSTPYNSFTNLLLCQQFANVYRLISMMIDRTQAILANPSNDILQLTKFTIFLDYPFLNWHIYDIFLAVQYFEVLRLFWQFQNIMQVTTNTLSQVRA